MDNGLYFIIVGEALNRKAEDTVGNGMYFGGLFSKSD